MEIPYKDLAADTLTAIIEEFITREGTEYGEQEFSLADKVEQVRRQLQRGEIFVSFDPESQTCQINAQASSKKAAQADADCWTDESA
ncbi:MAG: YheU family protein [Gammaproteobacteria bacterium]|nr:YheU family protein [Gammaproteobacteria bacterium]